MSESPAFFMNPNDICPCQRKPTHYIREHLHEWGPIPESWKSFRFTGDSGSSLLYYGDQFVAKFNASHRVALEATFKYLFDRVDWLEGQREIALHECKHAQTMASELLDERDEINNTILHWQNHAAQEEVERKKLEEKFARLPANWLEDSSLATWFPYVAKELAEYEEEQKHAEDWQTIAVEAQAEVARLRKYEVWADKANLTEDCSYPEEIEHLFDELGTSSQAYLAQVILDQRKEINAYREGLHPSEKADAIAEMNLMRQEISDARSLINAACEIMTPEQVGKWSGVRTWLEMTKSDLCPCCAGEGCWNCAPDPQDPTCNGGVRG